jgi:predicted MFS family arabinose efflux permease
VPVDEHDWKILFSVHNMKLWIEILFVTFCASCLWALYPTKGRVELHLNSLQYGSLLGFLGLGACVSAMMSDRMMGIGKTAHSLALSYLLYAIGLLAVGFGDHYLWMCLGMFLAGMGWIVLATLMNMSSRQLTGKSHLKATMLGVFLAVFYTGMSFGSVVWGAIARLEGVSAAFGEAALVLALVGLYKTNEARKALEHQPTHNSPH